MEKTSTQNHLDDVLKLATQQNNSFTKKYEEVNACETVFFSFSSLFQEKKYQLFSSSLSFSWKYI